MSVLSKYVFDPLKAAAARALSSMNPLNQLAGQAAANAVNSAVGSVTSQVADANAHNSAMGLSNPAIGKLETDLNAAVSAFVQATVAAEVPIIGGAVAPAFGELATTALTFAENHALTYLAGVFHFHQTNTVPALAVQPAPSGQSNGES